MKNADIEKTKNKTLTIGIILGAFMLGYFLGPVDVIPDFIPVAGGADDTIIMLLGMVAQIVNIIYGVEQKKKIEVMDENEKTEERYYEKG